MKKFFAVAATLLLALSLQANSCGPKSGGGVSCGSSSSNYKMIEALWSMDLNEDQEGKLDAIIKDHRKAMIDLEDEMLESSRVAGFGKDKFDRKEFLRTKEGPFTKMLNAKADYFAKIHAVLTPEQRAEFAASLSSCQSKRGNRKPQRNKK